jgi:hypothetical protein
VSEALNHSIVRRLAERRQTPCISIYMPTHRSGREIAQNPIRLKNLIRQAELLLEARPADGRLGTGLLEPAWRLLNDPLFGRHPVDGLALFTSEHEFEIMRLPVPFFESVTVADRFYLKPLLAYLNQDMRCFVLALSLNKVRLLEADRTGIKEVECPGLPRSMASVVAADEPEPDLRFHPSSAGSKTVIFHGHGEGEENVPERLLHFFRACDAAVASFLRLESVPLLLACVEEHAPLYRQVNSYPHLHETLIQGNPTTLGDEEIFEQACKVMDSLRMDAERAAAERYQAGKAHGTASNRLAEVLRAASVGRVDSVFIPEGAQVRGIWRPEDGKVVLDNSNGSGYDLLDVVGVETYLTGGRVFAVPPDHMPDRGTVAGVFRY